MSVSVSAEQNIKKYQYIDILRAIAILGVLAVHSHQQLDNLTSVTKYVFNYGQLGVQLFFVASALTLCLSSSERKETNSVNFYVRRFFRIAPLYYLGIVCYFLWNCLFATLKAKHFQIPPGYSMLAIIENLFFVHGFDSVNFNYVVPGGWSIGAEMTFYLIFPFLFSLMQSMRLRSFVLLAVAVAFASLVTQYILINCFQFDGNDEFGFMYTSILNQVNVFLIGMVGFRCLQAKITKAHLLFAAVLIVLSCLIQNDRVYDTGLDGFIFPILSSIAFVVLAIKLSMMQFKNGVFLNAMISIGQNSFSIYLIHFFVLDVLRSVLGHTIFKLTNVGELKLLLMFPTTLFITYLIAIKVGKYIEKPGINLGKTLLLKKASRSNISMV